MQKRVRFSKNFKVWDFYFTEDTDILIESISFSQQCNCCVTQEVTQHFFFPFQFFHSIFHSVQKFLERKNWRRRPGVAPPTFLLHHWGLQRRLVFIHIFQAFISQKKPGIGQCNMLWSSYPASQCVEIQLFFLFLFFFLLVKSGIAFCTVGRLGCTLRGASVTVSHTHKKTNKKHFEKKQMSRRFDWDD